MADIYLDANIFLRLLSGDDEPKFKACLKLFQQAKRGQVRLVTSPTIVAEVVYVLISKKHYSLDRHRIHTLLYPLLCLEALKLPDRKTVLRALDYFVQYPKLDFEDCFIVADTKQQRIARLYSYDRDFDGVTSIERVEPA